MVEKSKNDIAVNVTDCYRKRAGTRMVISKDTLDIRKEDPFLPLKSCIQISNPDGLGGKLNVKKARSVHFADTLGKPLKSIKTLYDLEDELELAFLGLRTGGSARRRFPVNKFDKQSANQQKSLKLVNFSPPISEIYFLERVQRENVLLENVIPRGERGVFGTVSVKNISFEKEVSVTYTLDDWETVCRAQGKYVPGSSTGTIDIFSFEINAAEHRKEECEIQFAVCYKAGGVSYWDSNHSKNYVISLGSKKSFEKKLLNTSDNYNGFIIPKHHFIGWAS